MHKVAHITDLHLGSPGERYLGLALRERFLKVLASAKQQQPDFYVLGGDYSLRSPDAEACQWLCKEMNKLNCPYFILSGNHDKSCMLADIFGLELQGGQLRYAFQYKGINHLFLDSSLGFVAGDQLRWLRERLQPDQRSIIWMHHPPQLMGMPFMDLNHPLRQRAPLLEVFADHPRPLTLLCGHYHAALRLNHGKLQIHVAPPTSFFIDTTCETFEQDDYPAGYQILLLGSNDRSMVVPLYVE
jgi:DNA repair exonuclease SbcCD nuclease subunit